MCTPWYSLVKALQVLLRVTSLRMLLYQYDMYITSVAKATHWSDSL